MFEFSFRVYQVETILILASSRWTKNLKSIPTILANGSASTFLQTLLKHQKQKRFAKQLGISNKEEIFNADLILCLRGKQKFLGLQCESFCYVQNWNSRWFWIRLCLFDRDRKDSMGQIEVKYPLCRKKSFLGTWKKLNILYWRG